MRSYWIGGVVALLCATACSVKRQSEALACSVDNDCDTGRACVDGFCLPASAAVDAAVTPTADAAPGADADTTDGGPMLDAAPLAIVVDPLAVTVIEGDTTATLDVSLTAPPGGSFDVTLESDDTGAAVVAPTTLSFDDSNFSMPQQATVSPVPDGNAANESVTITVSGSGVADVQVDVTVIDSD